MQQRDHQKNFRDPLADEEFVKADDPDGSRPCLSAPETLGGAKTALLVGIAFREIFLDLPQKLPWPPPHPHRP